MDRDTLISPIIKILNEFAQLSFARGGGVYNGQKRASRDFCRKSALTFYCLVKINYF